MPFYRPGQPYTIAEVRAILVALAEGRSPHPPGGGAGLPPAAHSLSKHWALQESDMKARACARRGPETVSCFTDLDTCIRAATAALNSPFGAMALRKLDQGQTSSNIFAPFPQGMFRAKKVIRMAPVSAANPHGAAMLYRNGSATRVFVRIYRHQQHVVVARAPRAANAGERLWIQTCFPEVVTPTRERGAPLPPGGVQI